MLDIQNFLKQYKNVVEWNAVARNGVHDFEEDSVTRQTEYVRSEILETFKGLYEDDHVEILDGVADIFVTMIYKHYLVFRGVVFDEEIAKCIEFMSSQGTITFKSDHVLAKEHLLDITRLVEQENEASVFDTTSLCPLIELMNLIEEYYEIDVMEVVEHVMDSNWSKYPKLSEVDIPKEIEYITEKMKDKGFKDIAGIPNQDAQVVVFRSDNGAGKIMKPSTFWNADCGRFL